MLGREQGLLRKDWLEGMSLQEALEYAITDFKTNYERYDQVFDNN